MDPHSLAVLEFRRVVDLVRERAPSALGGDLLAVTEPLADRTLVRRRLRETAQMRALRERSGTLPWDGSQDIAPHLERLRAENAWIDGPPLVHVAEFAAACGGVARSVLAAEGCPDLAHHAEAIPELADLAREIRRCLTPEGEVRDDASEELLRLRRGIGRARREVVGALERMMGEAARAPAIQEPIVTLREDRYVIPVKTGGRGAVPGIVHDRSASGQTVFVEPEAVVELNNALREQILAEREETRRILRSLSDRVRRRAIELRTATAAMAELEAIWARAVYADDAGMVEPSIFEDDGRLELLGARHPLLLAALGERTVPIDLSAGGGDARTLVVTGPNTGGKTVALKTAGLLCLMAQSGMHLPAEAGTGVSCFEEVLADIGDEQSIQQNLSTFSGHVRNVVAILGKAGPGSLVLLDELGAGTDPSEGAALGVAILEELSRLGALTIATTHHNAVKVYAATTPGAMNAAMEFDERTLRPTYRLLAGIPGRSQAFAIAERYGLDPAVIARAREQRTIGEERFDRLMEQLERERTEAARERREAAAASAAIAAERRELEAEAAKQQRSWAERKERLLRETRPALREADRELKEQLRLLREKPSLDAADRVRAAGKRLERVTAEQLSVPETAPAPTALAAGERVFVNLLQTWGTVADAVEGQGSATVIVGEKRVTVPLKELSRRVEGAPRAGGKVERQAGKGSYAYTVPEIETTRLDLRGWRAEEALAELERFLDAAVLNGIARVSILHGKGTGRLQEAVRKALAGDRRVAGFAFAPLEQGGAGVTQVTLSM